MISHQDLSEDHALSGKSRAFLDDLDLPGSWNAPRKIDVRPRILVIEENDEMREHFEKFVGQEFELMVVASPEEAYQLLGVYEVDLVIHDIEYEQEMEAVRLLTRLRQLLKDRHVRFIAITGYALPTGKAVLKRGQYDAYLPKPFTLQRLRDLLWHAAVKKTVAALKELNGDDPLDVVASIG